MSTLATPTPVRSPRLGGLLDASMSLIGLVLLGGILAALTPNFLTVDNLMNVLLQISINGIIAVGMTLVIVTAGIDLSVGSVVALSSVVAGMLMQSGAHPVVGVAAGLGIGTAAGLVNGLLVTQLRLSPFIATLGMMSIARGLAFVISDGSTIDSLPDEVMAFGMGTLGPIPYPVLVMACVAIAGWLVLSKTRLGRYSYAIGSNEEAVRLSGIPVGFYKAIVYTVMGLLSGLAGLVLMARVSSAQPAAGELMELDAIAAVVIGGASLMGGRGTVFGTLVGAAVMGVLRNGLVLLDVSAFWQQFVIGLVIVVAVALDQLRHRRA